VRVRTCLLGLALLAAGLAPAAAAPPEPHLEEHEARLKALGVDATLATRIAAAIDRGTDWLASVQRPDGSWTDRVYTGWMAWGAVALCANAQRHAGTPRAVASARRAMEWLRANADVPPPLRRRDGTVVPRADAPLSQVYPAALWAMLLAADGRPARELQPIADGLARSLHPDDAWWDYVVRSPGVPIVGGAPNLSTSQFAALGLRAARRAGASVDGRVWREHLNGLVRAQRPSGSWGYSPQGVRARLGARAAPTEYATGTFMGAANLALAMDGADLTPGRPFDREVLPAKARALEALRRDGTAFLRALEPSRPVFAFIKPEGFSYYSLYALEKACVFHDLDRLGDVPWYAVGSRHLLAIQDDRGSWSCRGDADPAVSTAFALLFLLRSSEVYRPTTPRDVVPARRPATTPSEPQQPAR
jgi:hypothetical protein